MEEKRESRGRNPASLGGPDRCLKGLLDKRLPSPANGQAKGNKQTKKWMSIHKNSKNSEVGD